MHALYFSKPYPRQQLTAKHPGIHVIEPVSVPYHHHAMKAFTTSLMLALSLAGCAKMNDVGRRLISSSAPALAVVNETLLSGEVKLYTDRTGTVELKAGSGLQCMGNMRYTASKSGAINLQCSDNSEVSLSFKALSETSGFASGRGARGPASLTFGLEPANAVAYLTLPPGKRIVTTAEGALRLQ